MFNFISQTPPETALLLGFSMGLALRRSRVSAILDAYLPGDQSGEAAEESR